MMQALSTVTANSSHSLLVLLSISVLHTPIKCMACSFTLFLPSLNKEHSLGTHERQADGMLVSPSCYT